MHAHMGSQYDRDGHHDCGHGHHIVVFPFMAQGHIIPAVALAARLASFPHTTVTLTATPRNAATIAVCLPAGSPVNLHTLPLHGPDYGLPPGAENTDSLPSSFLIRLFDASQSLKPHFRDLLNTILAESPTAKLTVVADVLLGWTVQVAREAGAGCHVTLTAFGGYGTAAYFSLWQHLPHLDVKNVNDDGTFSTPGFPHTFRLRRDQLSPTLLQTRPGDVWAQVLQEQIGLSLTSDAILCNSVEELEPQGIQLLRDYAKLRVWAVGPMFLQDSQGGRRSHKRAGKTLGATTDTCVAWLDGHPDKSVLYVCFGSQNTITASQMNALATALEASGVAFLWVVRPPIGHDLCAEFQDEWLPPGFEARVRGSGKGLVVRKWAPQPEILGHKAVGAFVSHCGWNSILEALVRRVPLIGWPMQGEQYYNSKMLVEDLGVCVEIARGVVRDVKEDELEKVIREMIVGEKGQQMRRRAAELAEVIREAAVEEPVEDKTASRKSSSATALDEFIQFALSGPSTVQDGGKF